MTGLSHSNSNQMLQQDFLSLREYTHEKLQNIDVKMDSFMDRIAKMLQCKGFNDGNDFSNPFGHRDWPSRAHKEGKGIYRNPYHIGEHKKKRMRIVMVTMILQTLGPT